MSVPWREGVSLRQETETERKGLLGQQEVSDLIFLPVFSASKHGAGITDQLAQNAHRNSLWNVIQR